ncbi:flavin reductase domain-containing protein [Caballeronia hypogeia]|uniref:Flavin reductase domain-containing protein n=1 Tax=Caballeronia hypogeia TaxID=1777140 RepID=A0A158DQZ9_9BURK|nr:flavin reductase family protein [Caballeronia hypogeia]SAK97005.1 flavin reductase domain-containing protein [Caballeronia hypogeia]
MDATIERASAVKGGGATKDASNLPSDRQLFRAVAGSWAAGVAVITSIDAAGAPHGLTMTAVSSLSIDPQQFLISVAETSETLRAIRESNVFCINMLESRQEEVSRRFATKTPDKFDGVAYTSLPSGAPLIDEALAYVECEVVQMFKSGDHQLIVGAVLGLATFDGEPLLHYRGGYKRLTS